MNRLRWILPIVFACTLPGASAGQVTPNENIIEAPGGVRYFLNVPLTTALSRIGYNAKGGESVVFGIEMLLNEAGEEPRVTLRISERDDVQAAVSYVVSQLPATHPPFGWIYAVRPSPERYAGREHRWSMHRSVPEESWREAVAARREGPQP